MVECVNPVNITRDALRSVADRTNASFVEVELICSDPIEHRRRVETRTSDVAGLTKPAWEDVAAREYETWEGPHLAIDTAGTTPAEAAACISMEIAIARDSGRDR